MQAHILEWLVAIGPVSTEEEQSLFTVRRWLDYTRVIAADLQTLFAVQFIQCSSRV